METKEEKDLVQKITEKVAIISSFSFMSCLVFFTLMLTVFHDIPLGMTIASFLWAFLTGATAFISCYILKEQYL